MKKRCIVFIGKLTHAANSWTDPEGNKRRDADAVPKHKRSVKRSLPKVEIARPVQSRATRRKSLAPGEWFQAWLSSCSWGGCERTGQQHRLSEQTRVRRSCQGITERQEEAFQAWWRESRDQLLQPRDPSLPSAVQRLEALKHRVLAKQERAME